MVIFRHLKGIVTDVNIVISKEKFYIQSMDSSHACLVEINIEASWFDNYEVDEDEVLGINSEILFKIIDCWKKIKKLLFILKMIIIYLLILLELNTWINNFHFH